MSKLVIVESPTKARTISSFLPKGYQVKASMGHVRDLPASAAEIPAKVKKEPWARLGVKVQEDFEPLYVIPADKKKIIAELRKALKGADELLLATDEDREGESIGWHLYELLKPKVPVRRMIFHEITKEAIEQALQKTRSIDHDLVRAQETRRILDRLVGYTISPLLWKKIAPKLSAGRVQSVAVRLLVVRERERRAFVSGSYWDLKAQLNKRPDQAAHRFEATLVSVGGIRVASGRDFDESTGRIAAGKKILLLDGEQAIALQERLKAGAWVVDSVESTESSRSPAPPFTTSTLQQEANRKRGWGGRHTMRVAQSLYENGYITYMRTDSVHLSDEAVNAARRRVKERYGEQFLTPKPRRYKTKAKGAQEAHEAIRPAGSRMRPVDTLPLSGDEAALYDMVWKRTVATQMANARLRFTTVTIAAEEALFRASGREILFPGFFRAYVEGSDDPDAAIEDQESPLPPLAVAEEVDCRDLEAVGHATKPPARYTEAKLVQTLETEGIGRPSTYATIIDTIQNRGYVFKRGKELAPTFVAFAVVQLLEANFEELVDTKFTAEMEQTLDDIAEGSVDWLDYLQRFYLSEQGLENQVRDKESAIDPRNASQVDFPDLPAEVRIGQFGPFLAQEVNGDRRTAGLPDGLAPADLDAAAVEALLNAKQDGPDILGEDPVSGLPVLLKDGPYGAYVQLGEDEERKKTPRRNGKGERKKSRSSSSPGPVDINTVSAKELATLPGIGPGRARAIIASRPYASVADLRRVPRLGAQTIDALASLVAVGTAKPKTSVRTLSGETEGKSNGKPKRVSLLKGMTKEGMDLPTALQLLNLPRLLGSHPEDDEEVRAGVGRYGPYVVHKGKFVSLKTPDNVLEVDLPRALALINAAPDRKRNSSTRTVLKELGAHPDDGDPIRVLDGRYGPYVNHKRTNATVPKEGDPQSITLEQALQMLAEREGKGRGKSSRRKKK